VLLGRGADPSAPLRAWTPTRRDADDFNFAPALVGATPFWLAARFTEPNVMRLLVEYGADPRFVHRSEYYAQRNQSNKRVETTTALMAATGMGGGTAWMLPPRGDREALTLETVQLTIDLGVDVNAANTDGRTALDAAQALKYESVVKFLTGKGAKPGVKPKTGTP